MTGNVKYVKGSDGKMKGSIGKGKKAPTAPSLASTLKELKQSPRKADLRPDITEGYVPGTIRSNSVLKRILDKYLYDEILDIAKDRNTPEDILLYISNDQSLREMESTQDYNRHNILSAAIANETLSAESLEMMYNARYPKYYHYNREEDFLANPNLSEAVLRKIANKDPYAGAPLMWIAAVSKHKSCPEDLLIIAAEAARVLGKRNPVLTRRFVKKIVEMKLNRYVLAALIRNPNVDKALFYPLIPDSLDGRYPDGTRIHADVLRAIVRYSPATPERQKATEILQGYKGYVNEKVVVQKTQDADFLLKVASKSEDNELRELALLNSHVPEEAEVVAALQGENLTALRSRRKRT